MSLFINLAFEAPEYYFTTILVVVISVVLHELGHGFAAIRQGDDTPIVTGHMTLNPLVHMQGFGLFLLFFAGIAFGAMPVSPTRFRGRYGAAVVAFAGPAVNLILAAIGILLFTGVRALDPSMSALARFALLFSFQLGLLNLVLFAFNLLPLPPLDGATVLGDLVPGFRRFAQNPGNQVFFMGGFMIIFFSAGQVLFPAAESIVVGISDWLL